MTPRMLSILGLILAAVFVSAPAEQPVGTEEIRWATYNIAGLNGWHRRQDDRENQFERARAMGRAMRTWNATVIGLQELPRDEELQGAIREGMGPDWNLRALPINASPETLRTVGVLWRVDCVAWSAVVPVDERMPTYWGAADLVVDGLAWRVHVGKLSPGQTEAAALKRLSETKKLSSLLRRDRQKQHERVVILADLNAALAEASLVRLLSDGWKDALEGSPAARIATKHDRGEETYRRRLDYILIPRELAGSTANGTVVRDVGFALPLRGMVEPWSDHQPVWVDWVP
ncbi:MAG: hypothetical protein SynsKO_32020 [Synoicihabitans sp.]